MAPPTGRSRPAGDRAADGQLREGDGTDGSRTRRGRQHVDRRQALAQRVDERVEILIDALAPDPEAQERVREIRRQISGSLDMLADSEDGGR
jgi:hypothetical protein